ncbi:MAG: glycosyltransferase family 4 protein [Pseudomonadales bacterium]|nr:glycosyltransferase family 4 protein [Pseudomonadales bacterium]
MQKSNEDKNGTQQRLLISGLVFDQGRSGIAEYTRSLTKALLAHQQVYLPLLKKDLTAFAVSDKNLHVIVIANFFSIPVLNIFWHLFILPFYVYYYRCDAVILPAINRRMSVIVGKPVLGIVHDLSQYHVKGKYDWLRTAYVKYLLPRLVSQLQQVVAISECTKQDVIRYWKVKAERIQVHYNGFDKQQFNAAVVANQNDVMEKYQLTSPYLLYVSRIEHPGKNHINLVRALEKLPDYLRNHYQLVFAGDSWNGSEVVFETIKQSSMADRIHCLGYVPAEDIAALYHGAEAMIFPSLYEGFGMPLLEAMACGTPTLCSNCSALAEVAADAALTFDPKNPADIAAKIEQIYREKGLKQQLVYKGFSRSQCFDWDKLALAILSLLAALQPCQDANA